MLVGYARVSTNEQETRMQLDALRVAGVRTIYAEKTSGVGPRPELHKALASLQPGYTLVVYKMDRLARSLKDLLHLLERLRLAGCSIKSLTEPIDTSTPMGEFVLQILGAVAQLERSIIRERCEAGRVAARARGVLFGRQPLVIGEDARVAAVLYRAGFTLGEIAVMFEVSPTAVRSALVRDGVTRRAWGGSRYRRLS
jgi:DNA invertase Pin-like site-specific DNA recombinase